MTDNTFPAWLYPTIRRTPNNSVKSNKHGYPSPNFLLPSSHSSVPYLYPSPHTVEQPGNLWPEVRVTFLEVVPVTFEPKGQEHIKLFGGTGDVLKQVVVKPVAAHSVLPLHSSMSVKSISVHSILSAYQHRVPLLLDMSNQTQLNNFLSNHHQTPCCCHHTIGLSRGCHFLPIPLPHSQYSHRHTDPSRRDITPSLQRTRGNCGLTI